jgi:predicted acetyltransferase
MTSTSFEIRPLTEQELPAAVEMNRIAFGGLRRPAEELEAPKPQPGAVDWGLFDGGRLVAKANDREQQHWFGGRPVPASGFGGVAAAPEWRGGGVAGQLLTRVLAEARARGAAINTLYRTVPGVYRRLGWEDSGVTAWSTYPTIALAGLRIPAGMSVRPATAADLPTIGALYRQSAEEGNGLLERSAPWYTDTLERNDGVTMAIGPDGAVEGYARWERGTGYSTGARLTVSELLARTGPAVTALLANLASWGEALPTLAICLPQGDPVSWAMPVDGTVSSLHPWMLRIIDAAAAVAARGWPRHLTGSVDLEIADEVCPWNAGRRRLIVEDGRARLEPGGSGSLQVSARGLALLYAGGTQTAALRRASLVAGDSGADAFLDAATAGPTPALLDAF